MEQQELLDQFNGLLDSYQKHREYIRRVAEQSDKFSQSVIERVTLDHEVKSAAVSEEILPLVPELLAAIGTVRDGLDEINEGKSDSDTAMEELNLRLAIGEIDEAEFEELSADLRGVLDDAAGRLDGLGSSMDALNSSLERWTELAAEAGHETGVPDSDGVAAEAEAEAEAEVEVEAEAEAEVEAEVEAAGSEDSEEEPPAPHEAEPSGDESESAAEEPVANDVVEVSEDDSESVVAEVDESVDEVSFDAGVSEGDVDLDLVGGGDGSFEEGDEIAIDLDAADGSAGEDDESNGADDETRRALLLCQEGTPEEQIYPFSSDVLTVGRGRDNDIQIKNDSKVSRFHCKLYRRNGNYYIEDNKSSNGTLVNSELITERRLFGGEEVIIGETFFRFRLM